MTRSSEEKIGQRLRQERLARNWSQERLAEMLGTTSMTIRRWEHGAVLPQMRFRNQLSQLFQCSNEELFGLSASTQQQIQIPAQRFLWNVPYPRNPFFTGRASVLQQLHEALYHRQTAIPSQSYALSGLGGVGKTQAAIEYAYRYVHDYSAIFWISADTTESIIASFVALADLLDLPEKQEREQQRAVTAVTRWLAAHTEWLLVFDNVEEIELVKTFIPPACYGSLLFTSRKQALGITAQAQALEKMTEEEGMRFLLYRARRLSPTDSLACLAPQEQISAREIVVAMDGLPLAIDQAGAYIDETQCCLEDYLHLYHQRRYELLGRRGHSYQNHAASVETTLSLSFRQLEQKSKAAAEVLRLCAFFAPEAIPEEVLTLGLPQWSEHLQTLAANPLLLDEAIAVLGTYSLMRRDTATKTLSMHRLVQAVLQDTLSEQEQVAWIKRVISAINQVFPEVKYATWGRCERLLPHMLLCARQTLSWGQANDELATLLLKAGKYLMARIQYQEVEQLLRRALHMREAMLGPEHPDVAEALNMLGNLYYYQGRYAEAEVFYQKVLAIREQTLDAEHPDLASAFRNLGIVYRVQEKYAEAEELLKRTLLIWETVMGTEHLNVASPLTSLGILYQKQGKYAEAEPAYQRALRIREQALGTTHPDVAELLNNLGLLYSAQGKYAEAESTLKRALDMNEQALGIEHRNVANMLDSLGSVYAEQGKYAEAEAVLKRALDINERALGVEHPQVAYPLDKLGKLYCEQGRYGEAEQLLQRALSIREQALGTEHSDTAESQFALACLFLGKHDSFNAQQCYQCALAIWENTLGLNHPRVANSIEKYQRLVNNV